MSLELLGKQHRLIEEERSVDGVLVRTSAGRLALRHPRCLRADDRIEARSIIVGAGDSDETRRCSLCGELIPWSPRS